MLQVAIKITLFLIVSAFSNSSVFAAKAKMSKKQIEAYKAFSNTTITVQGQYQKSDKHFVYLKVDGSKNLIKVNRKYLLNSPSFLAEEEVVSVSLPIGRHLTDNKNLFIRNN